MRVRCGLYLPRTRPESLNQCGPRAPLADREYYNAPSPIHQHVLYGRLHLPVSGAPSVSRCRLNLPFFGSGAEYILFGLLQHALATSTFSDRGCCDLFCTRLFVAQLGLLTSLRQVYLSGLSVTGTLPLEACVAYWACCIATNAALSLTLSALKRTHIAQCACANHFIIISLFQVLALSSLQYIDVGYNTLSGTLPASVSPWEGQGEGQGSAGFG